MGRVTYEGYFDINIPDKPAGLENDIEVEKKVEIIMNEIFKPHTNCGNDSDISGFDHSLGTIFK